jgi:hypothetical protein
LRLYYLNIASFIQNSSRHWYWRGRYCCQIHR